MKQSLLKLLDVILDQMEDIPDLAASEGRLRSWLQSEGYNKRDIDQAIRLVGRRLASQNLANDMRRQARAGSRVLTPYEDFKLSREARNALVRLETYGLVDPYERELVLDRLSQFEGEIGLDELDFILAHAIYATRDYETQQTLMNVLDGERSVFH